MYGDVRFFFGDIFQLEGALQVGNNYHHLYESSLGWLVTKYDNKIKTIFSEEEGDPCLFTVDFPYKAGMSFGNDFFSLILGRYRQQFGNGKSGNLMIGDNFMFQDIVKASFFSRYFTYAISVTRFDPMKRLDDNSDYYEFSRNKFRGDHQFRIMHQLNAEMFDRVRLSVNLMTLYNTTSSLDIRFFYPFMIQHNYSNYDNTLEKEYYDEANNQMGINLDITLEKGLQCSFQFLLDQAQTQFETESSIPTAYALLGNLSYSLEFDKLLYDGWFECVYTNPYVYLNGKHDTDGYDYNLDYIVGNHMWFSNDIAYSGYEHGPDAVVIATGHTFSDKRDKFRVGSSILYRMKGEKGYKVRYRDYHKSEIDMSDATLSEGENKGMTPTGVVEHMIQLKVGLSYDFGYNLSIYSGLYSALYYNYEGISGQNNVWKNMFTIGMKWYIACKEKSLHAIVSI